MEMSRYQSWWVASVVLAIVALAAVPGASLATGGIDWKLSCRGNWSASVTWNWTQDGVDIPGAGGSQSCYADATLTGTQNRPPNANGFHALLSVVLPPLDVCTQGDPPLYGWWCHDFDSVTKSFKVGQSFKVQVGVSASGYYFDFGRVTYSESARFTFSG